MKKSEFVKKMAGFDQSMTIENRESDFNRARSVTVGTAFGGTTEVTMRMNSGRTVWAVLQPVEVIELIHQLAANVGCHVALKPRNDFASWRKWKVEPHMDAGPVWPPFVNDMEPHKSIGAEPPPAIEQPGLQPAFMAKDEKNETVAIKKSQNRRSIKRTAKAA